MPSHFQLASGAMALAAATCSAPAWSAECACTAATCATVSVDADNWTDLNCERQHIGQNLSDSDGDGVPDACDACPCVPNPPDPETGVIPHCPAGPHDPPHPPQLIRCEGGSVVGIPARSDLWFVRPTTWAFTRFENNSSHLLGGAQLLWVRNLDVERCEAIDRDGVHTVKLTSPTLWYSRAALFIQAGSNLSELAFDAAVGLKLGVDYARPDSWWSVGATVHLATLFPATDPTPLFAGIGPRIGLLDLLSLTPFVQLDLLEAELSYGAWLEFEWGVVEDLGLTRSKLLGLIPGVPE